MYAVVVLQTMYVWFLVRSAACRRMTEYTPLFCCIYLALTTVVAGVVCLPVVSTRTRDGSIEEDSSGGVAVGVVRFFLAHTRLAGAEFFFFNTYIIQVFIVHIAASRDSRVFLDVPYNTHVVPTLYVLSGR